MSVAIVKEKVSGNLLGIKLIRDVCRRLLGCFSRKDMRDATEN